MPDSAVLTFTDPDAYHAALRDVQAEAPSPRAATSVPS
jgi:hypothetical protein